MLKRSIIILVIAAAHFFISNALYGIGYRRTTRAIIGNGQPTLLDSILWDTHNVLMLPYDALSRSIPVFSASGVYVATSLLWAIVLYSIFAFLSHYGRARKTESP